MLIHGNYMSHRDLDVCRGFDVETIAEQAGIDGIRELHAVLTHEYENDESGGTASG